MDDTRLLVDLWAATRRATASMLLKDAAHELKNRLGVVHANVIFMRNAVREMLQSSWAASLDAEMRAQLQEMDAASVDVVTAIRQISAAITQAKERAARQTHLIAGKLDVGALVPHVLARCVGVFQLPLDVDIEPGLPAVHADAAGLTIILLELLANADQAVSRRQQAGGKAVLAVRAEGGGVVLSVQDNGPGLGGRTATQAMQPRVLAPQGDGAMGLAMCRELAREVGGELQLTSSSDGTVVRVSLRLT